MEKEIMDYETRKDGIFIKKIYLSKKKDHGTVYCKDCGTNKLYVTSTNNYQTFVTCPDCGKSALIHEG